MRVGDASERSIHARAGRRVLGPSMSPRSSAPGSSAAAQTTSEELVEGANEMKVWKTLFADPTMPAEFVDASHDDEITATSHDDEMKHSKPLLVCTTAPCLEGMAFCKSALESGEYRVRALCRNAESPRAKTLAAMGAEIVVADNLCESSLIRGFKDADGIYAIVTWSGSAIAPDGRLKRASDVSSKQLEASEVAQGLNILRAAEQTPSLRHLVLQSMHRGGREAPDPKILAPFHHRAKWQLEDALAQSHLPSWSILRQPTYLENFGNDETTAQGTKLVRIRPGVISGLLDKDEELTVIAVADLGALAVRMLAKAKHQYTLSAGAERINGRCLAEAASRVSGNGASFEYKQVPWYVLEFFIPVKYPKQLKAWLGRGGNDEGFGELGEANLAASRELYPEMTSVEDWLRQRGVEEMPPQRRMPLLRYRRSATRSLVKVRRQARRILTWSGRTLRLPIPIDSDSDIIRAFDNIAKCWGNIKE